MKIQIPELSLVALIGPSGSGKSSFARKHFLPTEVISSDFCRALVSDDENNQAATGDAFDLVYYIARKRLAAGKLVVIDATSVMPEDRKKLLQLAKEHDCLAAAIVFDVPEKLCYERNKNRSDRDFGEHVIRRQHGAMKRALRGLAREGFRYVEVFKSEEEVNQAEVARTKLWNDRRQESGPFDIIGDVHGCYDELKELLSNLGYEFSTNADGAIHCAHPQGRQAIFVGDLVDRGPNSPDVLRLVMSMVAAKTGICVPGNHDVKLMKKLRGRDVRITHGLQETLDQLEGQPEEFLSKIADFVDKLVSHLVFDEGKLVVAHAGMKQIYQGRSSGRVREFALYGETTGETDEYGLPVRYDWAQEYRGDAMVVYGHTPVPEPEWINRTVCVDTGCVFGGKLTALRYPEREFVSVKAAHTYYEPARPFLPEGEQSDALQGRGRDRDVLDINDVIGKRNISTALHRNVIVREENAIAALEVMSRFAVNPKWIIYLPPTMSPSDTSKEEGLLEHPSDALRYFASVGVPHVVCEEKHMGSRAIVIVCRDEAAAFKRFGVRDEGRGICYTRTGRRFFNDLELEQAFITRVHDAATTAGLWDEFNTDWLALDCELMPWSAKAQELLRQQYAAVGAAAMTSLPQCVQALSAAVSRDLPVGELLVKWQERLVMADQFRQAYRGYCWTVNSLDDIKLAPFHLLATEKATHFDKDHEWHMHVLARLASTGDDMLVATPYRTIDLTDPASFEDAVKWWFALTEAGGEGMVVKPKSFIARGQRGLVQPAVKCRGREYLRIIYGPEYTAPEHLSRLRQRGLSAKRSLALREFALGVEAVERFVRHEPLYRVHECVFGVLALESEPVDPRL